MEKKFYNVNDCVTDIEIKKVLKLRGIKKELQNQLKEVSETLLFFEECIIKKISTKAHIFTSYEVHIKDTFRRYPSWREHFIEKCGKSSAEEVLSSTPAKKYQTLIIK